VLNLLYKYVKTLNSSFAGVGTSKGGKFAPVVQDAAIKTFASGDKNFCIAQRSSQNTPDFFRLFCTLRGYNIASS